MDNILAAILVGTVILIMGVTVSSYVGENLAMQSKSIHDMTEYRINKNSEHLKIHDKFENPLQIIATNVGENDIEINKMLIDGQEDVLFTIDGIRTDIIESGSLVTITPTISNGDIVEIITKFGNEIEVN